MVAFARDADFKLIKCYGRVNTSIPQRKGAEIRFSMRIHLNRTMEVTPICCPFKTKKPYEYKYRRGRSKCISYESIHLGGPE
jgi:hypothetical protein